MREFPDQFLGSAIEEVGAFIVGDGKAVLDVVVRFLFTEGDHITIEINSLGELSQFLSL